MNLAQADLRSEDGTQIPVEVIIRPIRSRYRLTVSEKGARLVMPPSSRMDADMILGKHSRWISRHYGSLQKSMNAFIVKDGSEIPYRGGRCLLKISAGENSIAFDSERLVLDMQISNLAPENLKRRLALWYFSQSANFAKSLSVNLNAPEKFGMERLVLKDMSTRWGTCCRKRKIITLNWRLILAPDDVYEYVFLHELAHFRVPGHGRRFWEYMEVSFPGTASRRTWLNRNGHALLHFLSEEKLSPERIV